MMKAMENEMEAWMDIDTIVYSAFSNTTTCDCEHWIEETGILNCKMFCPILT